MAGCPTTAYHPAVPTHETHPLARPPPSQLGYALKQGIPYLALFGEAEVEAGVVKVRPAAQAARHCWAAASSRCRRLPRAALPPPAPHVPLRAASAPLPNPPIPRLATPPQQVKDLDAGTEEAVPEAQLTARLRELVATKAGRRIVYQTKEEEAREGEGGDAASA